MRMMRIRRLEMEVCKQNGMHEVTMTRRRTMKVRILGTFRMMIRRKERDTGGRRGQRRGERGWVLCE